MKEYYDARASEYDQWYRSTGLFAARERPDWHRSVQALTRVLAELPPVKTLDVACGTGFLTRHLPGSVIGLDQSHRMLAIARSQAPAAKFVRGDALRVPFEGGSFERVFTGHFYGHLTEPQRTAFLREARRLAPELVIVDSAVQPDHAREEWQDRVLTDGSRFRVYKRYFDAAGLVRELGGGEVLLESRWFVAVSSRV